MSLDVSGTYRYPPPRPDWLEITQEDIIGPERPIVDCHHHIWEEGGSPYLLDDLLRDTGSGHNILATVLVQASYSYRSTGPTEHQAVGETEAIVALIEQARAMNVRTKVCDAIVGYANLCLGDAVVPVLEDHVTQGRGHLRGIRHSVSRDSHFPEGIVIRPAPAHLLADPAYRVGLSRLTDFGLSYDAMLYHEQIRELTDMACALPHLPIVLNHYGGLIGVGPHEGRERERFLAWRRDIAELANCSNVSVKLGGLGMIICGARWHLSEKPPGSQQLADAWRPYFETCVELFGANRCMFESNFPVDKAMYSYAVLWNAFKRLANGASEDEKHALFCGSAARFYRIEI